MQQQHLALFAQLPQGRFQQLEPRVQDAALELMAALIVQVHRTTEQNDHDHSCEQNPG
jgi:hypothetical protein